MVIVGLVQLHAHEPDGPDGDGRRRGRRGRRNRHGRVFWQHGPIGFHSVQTLTPSTALAHCPFMGRPAWRFVGGDWTSYSATITGNVSVALTSDSITLNGQPLPAGTYSIKSSLVTLSGGGGGSFSPSFTGSASINATNRAIDIGPGAGSLSLGGQSSIRRPE